MKDVGKRVKEDDAGYALLYTLGVILLISLLMMGIFMHARNNYVQIKAIDRMTKTKDIKEYALQEAAVKLKKTIREKVSANSNLGKGRSKAEDVALLRPSMMEAAAEVRDQIKKTGIGKDKDFSYEVNITTTPTIVATSDVYKYVDDEINGTNGWVKTYPDKELFNVTNTQTTFSLEVKITQTRKGTTPIVTKDQGEYIYEFQWLKNSSQSDRNPDDTQKLETWRYIYYNAPMNGEEKIISADTLVRKMDRIRNYQDQNHTVAISNFANYVEGPKATLGGNLSLIDYSTINSTLSIDRMDINISLTFEGSLFDVSSTEWFGTGDLEVKNMFYLNNGGRSYIFNFPITAGTGIYVESSNHDDEGIIINNSSEKEITTPNLLINSVGNHKNSRSVFSLGKGKIIQKQGTSTINFARYMRNSKKPNPQDEYWSAFMNGGFVIAGSQVYLAPVNNSGSYISANRFPASTTTDERKIILKSGNFMLTSASMGVNKGEEDLSYFDKGTLGAIPRQPSLLELEGANTSMIVESGVSFIDAPKTKKRTDGKKKGSYYNNSKYWNTIRLKEQSQLDLGTVGVEPFNLEMEEDTILTMKLLPDLLLFDTTFIENGFKKGSESINGKLILKPATVEDATKLNDSLKKISGVNVSVKTDEKDAVNGEVTIITPTIPVSTTAGWVTQRVFEHSELK
ncbi:hypothetical protein GIX45_28040 [Erwinia sp. CPCC 100877]|nr:hypothetical protein [Erwinia sp. CPCC 100877]